MKKKLKKSELFSRIISFEDNLILPDFFGSNDENLKKLEDAFGVSIFPRGNYLKIEGLQESVECTEIVLKKHKRLNIHLNTLVLEMLQMQLVFVMILNLFVENKYT